MTARNRTSLPHVFVVVVIVCVLSLTHTHTHTAHMFVLQVLGALLQAVFLCLRHPGFLLVRAVEEDGHEIPTACAISPHDGHNGALADCFDLADSEPRRGPRTGVQNDECW